jgi:hypothetical protein
LGKIDIRRDKVKIKRMEVKEQAIWLGTMVSMLAGAIAFVFMNFASASDVQRVEGKIDQLNAIVLGSELADLMFKACEQDPRNAELTKLIADMQNKYLITTGKKYPWVC